MPQYDDRARFRLAVVFLGAFLESALLGQSIAPRTFRAVAGEARTAALRDGIEPMTAITSTRTTPPLEFPIRVLTASAPEPSALKLVIPPATPPGNYTVEVAGRGPDGRGISTTLRVTVDAVTFSRSAVAVRPPVILLNGFQLICSDDASTLAASVDTFGQLASLLQSDGATVAFFNNCTYGDISIEQLAGQLNNYIAGLQYTDGTPVTHVDLVAHSMGGLIARAYLAGKGQTSGVFAPPANPKVRKLIAIATPHFGSFQAGYVGAQESEMALGNQFLWDLATWNQGQDDLRGVDALAVIGNAGTEGAINNASDGVVSLTSASLGFAAPDQRTRIVPYCHVTPGFLTSFGMSCNNNQGIADINDPSHLTAEIVRSFLANTTAWQSIGNPPSTDPFLKTYGGEMLALKGANDVYFTDLTAVSFDNGAGSLMAGPSNAIASLYYSEFIAGGQHNFSMTHSNGQVTTGTGTPVAGLGRALLFKFGPFVTSIQSATGGLPGLTVASGSSITVYGGGFSAAGTQLTANGALLTISTLSDQQITAFLPAGYNGLVQVKVANVNGQQTVNIMTAAAPQLSPSISLSNTQLQFYYVVGGAQPPAQAIGVSNSGGGSLSWSPTADVPWITFSATPSGFTASVNPSGLTLGAHPAAISVTAPGATNSPQTVTVTLTISASAQIPPASAARFVPITPCRISDTRNAAGPFGGPSLPRQTERDFAIPAGACGIPSTAVAYSLNVAVVPSGPLGYLTLWPTGEPQPLVATLNSLDGRIKSNAAILPAGVGGAISVFVTDSTDVILDINGYFVAASNAGALAFYPLTPCRVADTRNAAGPLGGPSLAAQSTRLFPIQASPCGVPANAQAYSLNFAAVPKGATLGYMTAWPARQQQPLVASLNDPTGTVLSNAVVAPAGTDGTVNVFTTDATDLVIDINGYFAPPGPGGLSLYTVAPCRVLDSRLPAGSPPFGTTRDVNVTASPCGVPAAAHAFVFNATVVPPGFLGYITMWPQGQSQPLAATLNAYDGAITNNMAIVPTTTGSISVFPFDPTQLVLDIFGYFAP